MDYERKSKGMEPKAPENKTVAEIPFGAFDSESGGFEYVIPEGMEAIIHDGKVIVREKKFLWSEEDQRMINAILSEIARIGLSLSEERKINGDNEKLLDMYGWLESLKRKGE